MPSASYDGAPGLGDLVAPGRCALLLQEVQRGVVGPEGAWPELVAAADAVELPRRAGLLAAAARRARVPVVHCTAERLPGDFGADRNARLFAAARRAGVIDTASSTSVQPLAGLCQDGDVVLPRHHGLSPMSGTELDSLLRNQGVTTVVVAGVSLNVAVPNLVFDAVNRAYQVVVVTDAVAGVPRDYGERVVEHTLRPLATLATAEEVATVWSSAPAG